MPPVGLKLPGCSRRVASRGILRPVSQPETHEVRTRDGIQLHTELWRPSGPARMVVALIHGGAEHVSRYDRLARELNDMGAIVFGPDHRGQGRSGGLPGHVERFEQYSGDLLDVLSHYRDELGPEHGPDRIPWFIWGHSMGGLITLLYLLDHQDDFPLRGVLLSAPLLGLTMKVGAFKTHAVRLLARLAPKLSVPTGIPPEAICRDPDEVARYSADKRRVTTITTKWAVAMESAIERVEQEVSRIHVPLHWYIGTGDKICDPDKSKAAFASLKDPKQNDQTLEIWDGYFHELHNEPTELREPVMAKCRAWIEQRVG